MSATCDLILYDQHATNLHTSKKSALLQDHFVALLCGYGLGQHGFYPRWQKQGSESTIAWDVEGYYWYLPSLFIYKDLKKQGFKDSILEKYKASPADGFIHGFVHEKSGNYVLKYTSGMAVLYAPAFFAGHAAAKTFGYDADGFSTPYKLSVQLWGLLFSFLGLYYLRKLLLLYYSDAVTAIVLFLLVLGTNYFNYASIDVGMSHTWLFTLYVFISSTLTFSIRPARPDTCTGLVS